MTVKQRPGVNAPDGSKYITITDGNGNTIIPAGLKQLPGAFAPDGSIYVCPTDGTGTPTFGGLKRPGTFAPDGSIYIAFVSDIGNLIVTTGGVVTGSHIITETSIIIASESGSEWIVE